MKSYSIDITDKLTQALSEELAKGIDRQIWQNYLKTYGPPSFSDRLQEILEKIKNTPNI